MDKICRLKKEDDELRKELHSLSPVLPPPPPSPPKDKGKGRAEEAPPHPGTTKGKTVVLHAAPTKFKPGQMRSWIEEDNKATRAQIFHRNSLVVARTQESREAGVVTGHLPVGEHQPRPGAPHGKETPPQHKILLI